MLVLTRRPGESIVIGNGVKLTVVTIGPGRVKIGIDAPPDVRINREEIHTRIQQEHEHSSDVLAAVKATASGKEHGDQNTMITSGSNTELLSSATGDELPHVVQHPAPAPPPPSAERLNKYRLPRKPR